MKRSLRSPVFVLSVILSSLLLDARGQTVESFTGKFVIPSNTLAQVRGVFWLRQTTLEYVVDGSPYFPWSTAVYGPSATNGTDFFALPLTACFAPFPPDPGGCLWVGTITLSENQAQQLRQGLWQVRVESGYATLIGDILPDSDVDGVPDSEDQCPMTPVCYPSGNPTPDCPGFFMPNVDSRGCLLTQLPEMCPCDREWKGHGQYIKCMKDAVDGFVNEGFLTSEQGEQLHKQAVKSDCGKK